MRLVRFFSLAILTPLCACLSVSSDVTVNGDETYIAITEYRIDEKVYPMFGGAGDNSPCKDGDPVLENGSYVCTDTTEGTIDEMIAQAESQTDDGDPLSSGTIEKRDNNTLFISFPIEDLPRDDIDPSQIQMMEQMFGVSLDGKTLSLSITGDEVLETTGDIDNNGKTARFSILLTEIINPTEDTPDSFDVLLKY